VSTRSSVKIAFSTESLKTWISIGGVRDSSLREWLSSVFTELIADN
jgi:hypothetical protein